MGTFSGIRLKFVIVLLLIASLSFSKFCFANEEEIKSQIQELKARIQELEQRLMQQEEKIGKQEELNKDLEKIKEAFRGLNISAGITLITQGTHNANGDTQSPKEDVLDASYSLDLTLEKEFEDYGKAFIHLETGDGAGVTDELKVFSNVNRDADDSDNEISLTEAWYEHYLKSIPLTFTFGKIDPTCYIDTNAYANDETTQFLGEIFRNSPTIEFPDNSFGLRFFLEPKEFLDINFTILDADSDWEDIFDKTFIAGQLNFKPKLFNREGNYRIFGWLNDQNHIRWLNPTEDKEENYGFGLSFDQEINDYLGVFLRYAWQSPKVTTALDSFSLEHAFSLGLQLKGNLWKRNDDILAIAFGEVFPSDDYKKYNELQGTLLEAKSEKHLETYYNFKVNEHLSLTPDIQLIWDPYGKDAINGDDTILVGGLRAQVDF